MDINTVPLIDFAALSDPATLRALDRACREPGFFQITGHGIDPGLIAAIRRESHAFFAQPPQAKRAISRTLNNPWGFYDRELTRNIRDWKQVYDYGPPDGAHSYPQWPAQLPAFRGAVQDFHGACEGVAFRLLGAIAAALNVPRDSLERSFQPAHTSFLRINYYPACPNGASAGPQSSPESATLGVNPHTDSGALTLLLQDAQPGLEVRCRGTWLPVQPRDDTLVVNIGDIVQVWSNDRYRAPLHRVRTHPSRERFSVPFFFNPSFSAEYAPLPALLDASHPPRYRPIRWAAFRARRAQGDYADFGEEIQISQFRIQATGEARCHS